MCVWLKLMLICFAFAFVGVPLVPFLQAQKEAFQNEQFVALLGALGIQKPVQGMVDITELQFFCWHFAALSCPV